MPETFGLLISQFGRVMAAARENHAGMEAAAQVVEDAAKAAIGTYDFGWPPLAASTLEKKGGDTPLLETGGFRDSIGHTASSKDAYIGSSDQRMEWFENGTPRMPPRPVLTPALAHNERAVAEAMLAPILRELGVHKL